MLNSEGFNTLLLLRSIGGFGLGLGFIIFPGMFGIDLLLPTLKDISFVQYGAISVLIRLYGVLLLTQGGIMALAFRNFSGAGRSVFGLCEFIYFVFASVFLLQEYSKEIYPVISPMIGAMGLIHLVFAIGYFYFLFISTNEPASFAFTQKPMSTKPAQ